MNIKNARLIFLREVKDQLRDRRTLFMVAVLPLLLYPALGVGMAQMMQTFSAQTRTVVLIGAEDLPHPPLLEYTPDVRFRSEYFTEEDDAEKLLIVTDSLPTSAGEKSSPEITPEIEAFLTQAQAHRRQIERLGQVLRKQKFLEDNLENSQEETSEELQDLRIQEAALKQEIDSWFKSSPVQVLIVVPQGFRKQLDEISRRLADRQSAEDLIEATPRLVIVKNSADEKSLIAARRVREAVRNWERQVLEQSLQAAALPAALPEVVDSTLVDLAEEEELSATLWSKLFPMLLVMMAVTGAFYPAIDLGAGEKERGTMETLLICPATRTEIVAGKFLTVMLFSLSTALLNLVSMGITSKYILTMAGGHGNSNLGAIASFPPLSSLVWVLLLAIPLAALFSGLSLALAMFAKSSKEGQYYLTPLLMITMGLSVFCLSPSVEINPFYSVYPIVGPSLLLKALLLGQHQPHLLAYALAVLISSFAYSAIALWWAIEQFHSEDVLFRGTERFELGPWIRHILRDREPTPRFTEAGFCFVMILLLQFASYGFLSSAVSDDPSAIHMLKVQMIYLLVTVGTPALLMAAMLTSSIRETLKLRWPTFKMLGVAVLLAFVLQPLSMELMSHLDWFFPDPPKAAQEIFATMGSEEVPLWLIVSAFALSPALFEELAFRGFILSGLERARNPWVAILLSAVGFGIVHMIPQQVFNAMLLGVVIGMMAVKSRSLLPGVLFHFLFNGTQVLINRLNPDDLIQLQQNTGGLLFKLETGTAGDLVALHFQWPVLILCLVTAVLLIYRLGKGIRKNIAYPQRLAVPSRLESGQLTAMQSGL